MRLLQKNNIPYRIEKLEIGDILLPSEYAIERKTVKDFCSSLFGTKNGKLRLYDQLQALLQTYEKPILLLEGGLAIRRDPINKAIYVPIGRRKIKERIWSVLEEEIRINPKAFDAAIQEIENKGIEVIQTYDAYHGALILLNLLKKAKKEAKERRKRAYPIVRSKPKLKGIKDQQLFFLSGLPGISIARAKKLLETYKTPFNAIMKIKRWDVDIGGIGTNLMEKVQKVLFTEYKEDNKSKLK